MVARGYGTLKKPFSSKEIYEIPVETIVQLIQHDIASAEKGSEHYILSLIYYASAKRFDHKQTVRCRIDEGKQRELAPESTKIAAWLGIFDLDIPTDWPDSCKDAFVKYMQEKEIRREEQEVAA
eukprot:88648-Hanusia_phi.AAC.1